jgi:hypothetical protein
VDDFITATITNTFNTATSIDDSFYFRIDKDGLGSGGLQTSFSSQSTMLTITDVIINAVSYAGQIMSGPAGQSLNVNNIPIVSGALNSIRIVGTFTPPAEGGQANYTGNLTFSATNPPIPEASTWAMRRRRKSTNAVRVSYA